MYTTLSTNFSGSLETGVDPRTGQFFVNLPLAEITGNELTGPNINLSARYSSLSDSNSNGLGKGISLGGVSFFNSVSRRLTLSNGESWPVDTSNAIPDRRLKDCIFSVESANQCKINWKNGVTEYLSLIGGNIYATSKIISPIGKSISYTWIWNGTSLLLQAITDLQSDMLCRFHYSAGGVLMLLWPDTREECRIMFVLQDERLSRIRRMVSKPEWMEWKFTYSLAGSTDKHTLTNLVFPTGMTDTVNYYKENGLAFPSNSNLHWLPAVESHTRHYGSGQPPKTSLYTYTSNNFLGRNASSDIFGSWSKQSDYIYGVLTKDYNYGSTEIISHENDIVRITRTYNNYHFLISTNTSRNGCIVLKETQYYAEIGKLSNDQPAQYMLPIKQTVTFEDNKTNKRTEETITKFDPYGNPIYSETPDGTITTYEYYPVEGNGDCPREPNGFVRFLKQKTMKPRGTIYNDTPYHISRYTYSNLGNTTYVVQKTVSEYENVINAKLLTRRSVTYEDKNESSMFGRIISIKDTKYENGENSAKFLVQQDFSIKVNGGLIIQNVKFTGHDGINSSVIRHQSTFSGRLYAEISTQGIETNYEYDLLGRVTRRTVCPRSEYENITTWEYIIDSNNPSSIETDASGNKNKTCVDGAGRIIRRQAFDRASSKWYDTFYCNHNYLGEVTTGVVQDSLADGTHVFPLRSEVYYGGWGEKKSVVYSDAREVQQQIDPINLTQIVYSQGGVSGNYLQNGSVTTILDQKSQLPVSKELKNISGELESICRYKWDGLGQLREEQEELGLITKRTYDEYGRVLTQTLPDGTTVQRTYAPHLTGNQIASITVTGSDGTGNTRTWVLGNQTFDSLGRLTKSLSGGRSILYKYDGSLLVPSEVTSPSGKTETYAYIPELGNAISSITADGITQTFSYATKTGKLLFATEADSVVENTWTMEGVLKAEAFTRKNQTRRTEYTRTVNGVPVTYKDITGKETRYTMNEHGRVTRIIDDSLTVDLTYDNLGRHNGQTVRHTVSDASLTTVLKFDNFGREVSRTIGDSRGIKLVLSHTWQKNGLLSTRTTHKSDVELRTEQYSYDSRNRLNMYVASGSTFPVDPYGHSMTRQTFCYDALNNLTRVETTLSDRTSNTATYAYGNANDPTQLTEVSNTHAGYPHTIRLTYDTEGRLILDEAGRTLTYDVTGRLTGITYNNGRAGTYHYDALNRLITQDTGSNDVNELYYRGSELVNEILVSQSKETRLIKTGHTCLGVSEGNNVILMATDRHDSLLWAEDGGLAGKEGKLHVWSPYGYGTPEDLLPGFNGERVDPISGTYHLGNGYRAYNPVLMRFNCPDSLSPFGAGGINPYAYCSGDPINYTDPSGHLSWQAITGIVFGAIGLAAAVFTAGASIAAAGGVMAAISSASATSLIIGGMGVVSDITAITSGALEDVSPEASSILGWVSLGTGLVGMATGLSQGVRSAFQARKLRNLYGRPDDYEGGISFFAGNGTNRTPKWYEIEHKGKIIYGADQEVSWDDIRDLLVKKFRSAGKNKEPKNISILSATHGTELGYNWTAAGKRREELIERLFYREDKTFKKFISKNFGKNHTIDVVNSSKMNARNYINYYDDPTCDVILGFCFSRNDRTLLNHLNLPPVTPYLGNFFKDIEYGHIDLIDMFTAL